MCKQHFILRYIGSKKNSINSATSVNSPSTQNGPNFRNEMKKLLSVTDSEIVQLDIYVYVINIVIIDKVLSNQV